MKKKSNEPMNAHSLNRIKIDKLKGFDISNLSKDMKTLIVSLIISLVLILSAIFSKNYGILANSILLSTFIVAIPQFIFIYERYVDLKEMEEKFPLFMRDVIEMLSSGMPLHKSILSVSEFDYGKLSPEIRKMANQLSWGVPLETVLEQFATRTKRSKRLYTSVKTVREAHLSGGDVILTLETITENSNVLSDTEKERKSLLNQYVLLMYAISFVFIGIVVAINNLMMPIFEISSRSATEFGIGNPCELVNYGTMDAICSIYKGTSSMLFSIDPTSISAYYVALFFYMSIIQSIFSGLVAGQIGENSVRAGIKHSLVMLSITFGTFYLMIYFGLMGV